MDPTHSTPPSLWTLPTLPHAVALDPQLLMLPQDQIAAAVKNPNVLRQLVADYQLRLGTISPAVELGALRGPQT